MHLHFIFASPIGRVNKKGEALQKICNTSPICETMLIYKAVATGNGKNEFYRETTHSNCK
jgi:hypothetical protein